MRQTLGPSGWLARSFLESQLTPLLALIALLLGIFAVLVTPREEEPQINVTFANVFIPFAGATASEVEQVVSSPAEQVLSEIVGVKHVYSVSKPGLAILTVQFEVGEERTQAIVRLYNKVFSNADWLPPNMGVGQPIIKPRGIDDVPVVALTLWSEDAAANGTDLLLIAHSLETELKRVAGTRDIYTLGGTRDSVRILLDPVKLAGFNIDLQQVQGGIIAANQSRDAGIMVRDNREISLQSGRFLNEAAEIEGLIVGMSNGVPIALGDVAVIETRASQAGQYVWFGTGPAATDKNIPARGRFPAVTLAIAKKPGSNAIEVADQVIERIEQLRGIVIPDGIEVTVTRNYGATANEKALTLIHKLVLATGVVVLLVALALGWREALIVGGAIVVTLALTLFASWAWGFTLNRVSLFALIFSIGILVDDAIVVVENIHRHQRDGKTGLRESIPAAVDEVGGPTILATLAVVAALLPMAFVSGLMGPYMSPIPINASMGMLISLAVAFIVTPWLCLRFMAQRAHSPGVATDAVPMQDFFTRLFRPLLDDARGRRNRWLLLLAILLLISASLSLAGFKLVVLKMLPFDNKSEVQVLVDLPEGSSLEHSARVVSELSDHIAGVAEVTDYEAYIGTSAPINFNGLVRQYYLRNASSLSDIQVNLRHKSQRERSSHQIAQALRDPLQLIGNLYAANVRIVEVPPGPPVLAPLVAEIYGIDYAGQLAVAGEIRAVFEQTPDIVDIDDSSEADAQRWVLVVDRAKAMRLGLNQAEIANSVATLVAGEEIGYLHRGNRRYPVALRLELTAGDKADISSILSLKLRSARNALVPLSEVITLQQTVNETSIHHKDLLPVVYVTADMAGELDSPLYGMFEVMAQLRNRVLSPWLDQPIAQHLVSQPDNPYQYSIKWDGEWQITYETFRDMGLAYSVGLLLIYLLVVAQFRSYSVPLVIMAPIPLTLIGVLPGHALLGAQFTATSMIGMIALAGIIVRNSILLVDFIDQQLARGMPLKQAVTQAAAVRARPITLTALAAILGAFFILDDPIFNGLAIALIFGILVSTLLTLVVIPVVYYALKNNAQAA
jgi:multidrug efflux pump subunit AcrB